MTKDEKIQRLEHTIKGFEQLSADTQSKIVKLERQLEKEVAKRKEYERMIPEPSAGIVSTEEGTQDLELHHQQDLTTTTKDEITYLKAESDKLQGQVEQLQTELEKSTREIEEKDHEITKKEDELKEMRERLEEQEAKREESQRKFESLEKVTKRSEARRVGKECRARWSPDH